MAKAADKKLRRSACFLCCSGVFREDENFSEKISSVNKVVVEVESSNSGDKDEGTVPLDAATTTTTGLFSSCSMFRMKNSSAKTVPLDTSSDKSTDLSEDRIHSSKSSNSFKPKWKIHKLFTKRTNSATKTMPFRQIKTLVEEEIIKEGPEQNNTLENRKSLYHHRADTSKDATCRKRLSFRRKIDAIRTGSSNQPGSPDVVTKPKPPPPARTTDANAAKDAATLKHSVSMPVPARDKRANQLALKSRVVPKKASQDDNAMVVNKFDPLVGMSIVVVTLIIMFVWGRLCAILCTSAWLYFVPRLRALKNDDAAMKKINGDLDLNSQEYKKRVVLEGFLERDHRAVPAL